MAELVHNLVGQGHNFVRRTNRNGKMPNKPMKKIKFNIFTKVEEVL